MKDPFEKKPEIEIKTAREILDPTIAIDDIGQKKMDRIKINQVADFLANEYPPKSSMYEWIIGFDFLGKRPKQHILNRIHILIAFKFPDINKEDILNSISDIIIAYKKATTDLTHLIDT